jgi:MbtH protein
MMLAHLSGRQWRPPSVSETIMHDNSAEAVDQFEVLVNDEQQYSLWPYGKARPLGWNGAGKSGSKAECLSFITEHWRDMRPASLKMQLAR